ncbi:glycosyltransferase family 61 protein [Yoonia sp. SS1-5]|uniref:Glycosyltransferase family 61 protein n=1 Tax=Yoonia rhodophyticola TaxID=3137370 RepID=A0AAN0MFR5_9RHOB
MLENAADRWEVAPGATRHTPPAIFLPDQIDRIADTEFSPPAEVIRAFEGGYDTTEAPTVGYRLRHVDLADGVLYAKGRERHLRARSSRSLSYRKPTAAMNAVMYESWIGNRWFGTWLRQDCLTHFLTEGLGTVVTTSPTPSGHVPRYEELLGMAPQRVQSMHFDELILFEDLPNNSAKADRARQLRARLLDGRDVKPLPGVFIVRGRSGDARVLENELEIAQQLADTYGFHILDPAKATVDEIAETCGEAAIIAGIEGSHLAHGLATMPGHATLLVIQPPDRVVATLKMVTDRQDQRYAFVVGQGTQDGFQVNWDDLQRTIDLLDKSAKRPT